MTKFYAYMKSPEGLTVYVGSGATESECETEAIKSMSTEYSPSEIAKLIREGHLEITIFEKKYDYSI